MKNTLIALTLVLFSASALAKNNDDTNDLQRKVASDLRSATPETVWEEYKIKKARYEINHMHVQMTDLSDYKSVFDSTDYNRELQAIETSFKKSLASLSSREKMMLIQSYEEQNPNLAKTLKNLR